MLHRCNRHYGKLCPLTIYPMHTCTLLLRCFIQMRQAEGKPYTYTYIYIYMRWGDWRAWAARPTYALLRQQLKECYPAPYKHPELQSRVYKLIFHLKNLPICARWRRVSLHFWEMTRPQLSWFSPIPYLSAGFFLGLLWTQQILKRLWVLTLFNVKF